jgi:ABC-2 type transport system permease protein
MLRGLWRLTWLEIKIFVREPLGFIGTVGVPVLLFLVLGRLFSRPAVAPRPYARDLMNTGVPVFASVLIALSAVLSLVTIIATYREGGILKRLRATPLRPHTILTAHVLVKGLLTAATLLVMVLVGKRVYPAALDVRFLSFTIALLVSTVSLLSIGFLIASVVPTARFAQPIGSLVFYPMLTVSGLFVPVSTLPPVLQGVSHIVPLTYAVNLLRGIWVGDPWTAHLGDLAALALCFALCTALSAKVFRWE